MICTEIWFFFKNRLHSVIKKICIYPIFTVSPTINPNVLILKIKIIENRIQCFHCLYTLSDNINPINKTYHSQIRQPIINFFYQNLIQISLLASNIRIDLLRKYREHCNQAFLILRTQCVAFDIILCRRCDDLIVCFSLIIWADQCIRVLCRYPLVLGIGKLFEIPIYISHTNKYNIKQRYLFIIFSNTNYLLFLRLVIIYPVRYISSLIVIFYFWRTLHLCMV